MARGDTTAQAGEKQGLANSQQLQGNASQIFSTLAPTLQGDVAHPQGFAPTDLAKINTANQESAGGSQAGAVGAGGLLAARTNNAGAPQAAIADATRSAGHSLSDAALKTQLANTGLKQEQRSSALQGEQGLYGTNVGGATGNLNAAAGLSNANTNAANQSWDWAKYLADPLLSSATTIGAARIGRG